jgi:hypothetical protein
MIRFHVHLLQVHRSIPGRGNGTMEVGMQCMSAFRVARLAQYILHLIGVGLRFLWTETCISMSAKYQKATSVKSGCKIFVD